MNALDAYKKARRRPASVSNAAGRTATKAINPIQAYKSVRRSKATPAGAVVADANVSSDRPLKLSLGLKVPEPSTSLDRLRTFGQGFMMNAYDELESGIRSGFAADKGEDQVEAKKRIKQEVNDSINRFRKESPKTALGLEVIGSLFTPMPGSTIRKAREARSAYKLAKGGVQEALKQSAKRQAKRAAVKDIILASDKAPSKIKGLLTGNTAKNIAEGALVGGTANAMGGEEGERGKKFIEGALYGGLLQGTIGGVAPKAVRFAKNKLAQPLQHGGSFKPYGLASGKGGLLSGFYKMASQGFSPKYRDQVAKILPKVESTLERYGVLSERGDTVSRMAKGRAVRKLKRASELEARNDLRRITDEIESAQETVADIKRAKLNEADETKLARLEQLERETTERVGALETQARELITNDAIPSAVDAAGRLKYKGQTGQDTIDLLNKDWANYGFKGLKDAKEPIKMDVENIIENLEAKFKDPDVREYAQNAANILRDRVFKRMNKGTMSGKDLLSARNYLRSESGRLLGEGNVSAGDYGRGMALKMAAEELEDYLTRVPGGVGKEFAADLAAYKARRALEGGVRKADNIRGDFTPKEYLNSLKSGSQKRLSDAGVATRQKQVQDIHDITQATKAQSEKAAGIAEREAKNVQEAARLEFDKRMKSLQKELADRKLPVTEKRDRVRAAISDYVARTKGGMQSREYKKTMERVEKLIKQLDFEPTIFTKMATNRIMQLLLTVAASGAGFAASPILAAAPLVAAGGSALAMSPRVQKMLAGQTGVQNKLGRALQKYNAVERGNLLGSIAARNIGKD